MSKRQNSLQPAPDPSIIAIAEELGRLLARQEFARMEQAAKRYERVEESDDGQSRDLRPILIGPAEPSLS
jgi:hypothetical protein